ncbi:MAG: CHASE3 domain-containing protein [Mycobacteriaceae bacterium]|nr:CHASE3 domain-containing protein [Mycobacteriaceae bacterium]MBV9640564.1 CHASE3 domain-containing protein [Mycobacteriaceae bacterium]
MTGHAPPRKALSLRQLIWICLAAMSVVFVASTVMSIAGRATVKRAVAELSGHLVTVQSQVAALNTAYVDQETGQRGYLLTGDPVFLEPYTAGAAAAQQLLTALRSSVAGDTVWSQRLDGVASAAHIWATQSAQPQIEARRNGRIPPDQIEAMTLTGKQQFDQLRVQLRALDTRTHELIAQQIDRIHAAQRLANIIQIAAAGVLFAVVGGFIALLQRVLTRPVNSLVRDVRAVADGNYDRPIQVGGPYEIAVVADAAETMRDRLRTSTTRLLEAERVDEQARLAADLHGRTIQRVFGLGLGLTSAAARRSPDLTPFITETDEIIRDLRQVIFNLDEAAASPGGQTRLRAAIIDVVETSAGALGFTPSLDFAGPVDECATQQSVQAALLTVLREALNNIAHDGGATAAAVEVVATPEQLSLRVQDNGIGVSSSNPEGRSRRTLGGRAAKWGGQATVRTGEGGVGTVVEWKAPLPSG